MDTYEFDEVKDIIENRRLTTEILNSILESTTRKIDLFDDVESRKILAFLKKAMMCLLRLRCILMTS